LKLSYKVLEKDIGRTVSSVMKNELRISSTFMRRLKLVDAVKVSGNSAFTNYILSLGETVEIDTQLAEPACDNIPEIGKLDILYETQGLLAVNKPVGILVHPSRARNSGTLSNFVAGYLVKGSDDSDTGSEEKPATGACHAVNRLDRDTSGIVLFAKNSYMKSLASEALSAKNVVKEYLALVYGKMPPKGTIDVPIKRKEELNMYRIPAPDGQRAVTHYEMIETFKPNDGTDSDQEYSLVKFKLETGRTHQIRVHCLHMGTPILGDNLYHNKASTDLSHALNIKTQALHAAKLSFTDPLTNNYIIIEAKAPFALAIYQ